MQYKVKYPDDYIREKRGIIAAAELTYVQAGKDSGWGVVTGEDAYVFPTLELALDRAADLILGDGPLDTIEFIKYGDGTWRADMNGLRRGIEEAWRHRKK